MNHIKEHQQYEKVRNCRRNACTDTAKARQPAMTINQKIIQNSIDRKRGKKKFHRGSRASCHIRQRAKRNNKRNKYHCHYHGKNIILCNIFHFSRESHAADNLISKKKYPAKTACSVQVLCICLYAPRKEWMIFILPN